MTTTASKKNPAREAIALRSASKSIIDRMATLAKVQDHREFTAQEQAEYQALKGRAEMLRDTAAGLIDQAAAVLDDAMGAPSADTGGFQSLGEFAASVAQMGRMEPAMRAHGGGDPRLAPLAAVPGTFAGEGSGSDGAFMVPTQFAQQIFTLSWGGDNLLPLCTPIQLGGNSLSMPLDQTVPWGNEGIRAYWIGEAQGIPGTKPVLRNQTLRLKKLAALVPVSNELMEDAPALADWLPAKLGEAVAWRASAAILRGLGGAQPLGILGSPGVVSVPKDIGQAAGTLSATNLCNMLARLTPGSYQRAVWLISNDTLPALWTLTLGNVPIYVGPSSDEAAFRRAPYGTLLGRPVMVTQHASPFGTAGDVQLHDFAAYTLAVKAGGMRLATSMHLYFDADAMAFRLTFRMDGGPSISAPINPANGSTATLSPFVVLGAR